MLFISLCQGSCYRLKGESTDRILHERTRLKLLDLAGAASASGGSLSVHAARLTERVCLTPLPSVRTPTRDVQPRDDGGLYIVHSYSLWSFIMSILQELDVANPLGPIQMWHSGCVKLRHEGHRRKFENLSVVYDDCHKFRGDSPCCETRYLLALRATSCGLCGLLGRYKRGCGGGSDASLF